MNRALRPNLINVPLSFIYVAYQFFFSFQGVRIEYFTAVGEYFRTGLDAFDWNNYFVRMFFLLILGLIVAFLIFMTIWILEAISINSHNRKTKKNLINSGAESNPGLFKKQEFKFDFHVKGALYLAACLLVLIMGFSVLSGLFEAIRYNTTDAVIINLIENNVAVDYASSTNQIIGFIFMFPIWYLYGSLVAFLYYSARSKLDVAKISDEHFAVVVDESPVEDENQVEIE